MNHDLDLIPCMILVSCLGVVAKTYLIPNDWSVGNDLLCHTLGAVRTHPAIFAPPSFMVSD